MDPTSDTTRELLFFLIWGLAAASAQNPRKSSIQVPQWRHWSCRALALGAELCYSPLPILSRAVAQLQGQVPPEPASPALPSPRQGTAQTSLLQAGLVLNSSPERGQLTYNSKQITCTKGSIWKTY